MDIYSEFRDRIGRAVAKFLLHAEGEGLDASRLTTVTLTFKNGALDSMTIAGEPSAKPAMSLEARASVERARGAVNRNAEPTEPPTDDEGVDNPTA